MAEDKTDVIFNSQIPKYISFDYGSDYLNIRNRFQKGYTSISGEPGYFYFRVFFDWDSPLLTWMPSTNLKNITAQRFLDNNKYRCNCDRRYKALNKFHRLLHFMVKDTPWAIRKIDGLGEACFIDPESPGKGKRELKITFSEEFTDFRITLLLDLYRYICYDAIQQRIILPENLRKFNLSVMYFGVPIKWFHTPISTSVKEELKKFERTMQYYMFGKDSEFSTDPGYANLTKDTLTINRGNGQINSNRAANYFQETVSVHMMHFLNCEISLKSTHHTFGQESKDVGEAFKVTPQIVISYDRCYSQDISEWFEMQISEHVDDYFDSEGVEFAPEPALNGIAKPTLKEILKEMGKVSAQVLLGADEYEQSYKNLTPRRRAIREQKLYGGSNVMSKLNDYAERALDAVTGRIADTLELGSLYLDNLVASALMPRHKHKNKKSEIDMWPSGPTQAQESMTLNIIKQHPNIYQ